MRNWNTDVPFSYTGREIFPAYLWGIETSDSWWYDQAFRWFPAYLWGIETQNKTVAPVSRGGISSLPMRNWNATLHLPPFPLDIFPAYLWGIETQVRTTPKEPCGVISSLPMRNWNWCKNAATRKIALISSLPMRNWNTSRISSGVDGTLFPAYLWGIETQYLLCDKTVMEEFPAYLWGIETRNIQR